MTDLSQKAYTRAISEELTFREAVEFLEQGAKLRTLRENLEKFSPGGDLRKILVDGLLQNHPHSDVGRQSIKRRVRGWLNEDKILTLRKMDAIEVCFILGLGIEEADEFVALVSGERLHWRNPDEVVYLFALKQGMGYLEAEALNREMQVILSQAKDTKEPPESSFTPIIRREIEKISTQEELTDYLREAAPRMGRYHNTAYQLFMDMMETLKYPEQYGIKVNKDFLKNKDYLKDKDFLKDEDFLKKDKVNVRSILKDYLYTGTVRPARKKALEHKKKNKRSKDGKAVSTDIPPRDSESVPAGIPLREGDAVFAEFLSQEEKLVWTDIQKQVSKGWPDETILSKMQSRKVDISRKVLILLFLATDPQEGDEEEDDPDFMFSEEELFEDLYQRLNYMLARCGFLPLDPRAPFDWLILYCISVGDLFEVDERMRGIFQEMFSGENPHSESDRGYGIFDKQKLL